MRIPTRPAGPLASILLWIGACAAALPILAPPAEPHEGAEGSSVSVVQGSALPSVVHPRPLTASVQDPATGADPEGDPDDSERASPPVAHEVATPFPVAPSFFLPLHERVRLRARGPPLQVA